MWQFVDVALAALQFLLGVWIGCTIRWLVYLEQKLFNPREETP